MFFKKRTCDVILYVLFWVSIIFIAILFVPKKETDQSGNASIYYPMYIYESKQTSQPEDADLSHAQTVWLYALEWCESRGVPEAINPVDLDGTPSYSSWQFKPTTFYYYAEKYNVYIPNIEEPYMKRQLQYEVIKQMVLHNDKINWHQQFPDCVRKLGTPPVK